VPQRVAQGPAELDLEFYQGDTVGISIWLPADLTGATVRLQVRSSGGAVLATLESGSGLVVIPGDLPPATPDNPAPTPPSSRIDLAPTVAQRDAVVSREAIYDLQVQQGAAIQTWLRGAFVVRPEQTV
jgi:hypothetical protein